MQLEHFVHEQYIRFIEMYQFHCLASSNSVFDFVIDVCVCATGRAEFYVPYTSGYGGGMESWESEWKMHFGNG